MVLMGRRKITDNPNDIRIVVMVQMYKRGDSVKTIAQKLHTGKQSVINVLKQQGVFIPNRQAIIRTIEGCNARGMDEETVCEQDKITIADIEALRRKIPIGFTFIINTPKGARKGNTIALEARSVDILVSVTNKDNKNFCQVKLDGTNILESVHWSELVTMYRSGLLDI